MKHLRLRRPSPSLVISVVALFVAMGGTGYAAIHLGKNTVGAAQIKTGAVGSAEVKNKSLRTTDLSSAAIKSLRGQKGATGAQGLPGANGTNGTNGAPGPSDAWAKDFTSGSPSFSLPPGSYVLGGGATATASADTALTCTWNTALPPEDSVSPNFVPGQSESIPNGKSGEVAAKGAITVTGPSNFTATLSCGGANTSTPIGLATVIKVGALH
jgi:hypothetical protein